MSTFICEQKAQQHNSDRCTLQRQCVDVRLFWDKNRHHFITLVNSSHCALFPFILPNKIDYKHTHALNLISNNINKRLLRFIIYNDKTTAFFNWLHFSGVFHNFTWSMQFIKMAIFFKYFSPKHNKFDGFVICNL